MPNYVSLGGKWIPADAIQAPSKPVEVSEEIKETKAEVPVKKKRGRPKKEQ